MALLDDIKVALRLSSDAFDAEVEMLVAAALQDMGRVGLELPAADDIDDPMVKQAVACYCKAHFGYDNAEAPRFDESYRRIVCDLMSTPSNSSYWRG